MGFRTLRLLVCLLALALAAAACQIVDKLTNGSPTGPTAVAPPAGTQAISYAALGASDVIGYGGTIVCVPLAPCPDGTGYVPVLVRWLQATRQVTVLNLGLPGGVLSPAIEALGRQYGRDVLGNIIDREMPFVPTGANLVTVFAGANDTNAVGASVAGGAGGGDVRGYIDTQVRSFGNDYATLIKGIRARAPGAYILLMNLPNMGALPYAQRYTPAERQVLQQISVGFSKQVNAQGGQGVGVVDLMCDAQVYDPTRLASDGFHPNDPGYAHLADLLQRAIEAGGPPAPTASCPQMTVY